jgi:bifunctional polynucleotide phosphatase/kinase
MIINTLNDPEFREKMFAVDYDWTLVNPKDGKTFPMNIDDWEWYSPSVPSTLKQRHLDGFMIVVFTNQSKPWKCEQITTVLQTLHIPVFICIATDKAEYKPSTIMYDKLCSSFKQNESILKDSSFFVGDALGRKSDFSDSDKVFADNIGITYLSPEKIFLDPDGGSVKTIEIVLSSEPEIIIMVGYPGSGKTTITDYIGDTYKSNTPKMIKASLEHLVVNKSIVFDATNSSVKKRKLYLDFARKHGYTVRCIHVKTSQDVSYKRNKCRIDSKQVPKIAYSVYKKHYEEPMEEEGFELLTI